MTRRALTAYQVAKDADVSVDAVQRFLNGERGLNLATADAVAHYLGMTLVLTDAGQDSDASRDAISTILEWRAQGMTLRAIADRLNSEGITTRRGFVWRTTQVKRVLDRAGSANEAPEAPGSLPANS
jgi:DNA-binding LacI/PurR family transcriptional regulator